MSDQEAARPRGRPRNAETMGNVLAVVRALVTEHGFDAVSVNKIAEHAGVAKQTLYRRWASKAEIVLDAFLESAGRHDEVPYDGLAHTLQKLLRGVFRHLDADGAAIRSLIAAAQGDAALLAQLRERFVEPRAEVVVRVLEQARAGGELRPDTDIAMLSDMIHGAFWLRLLTGQALDAAYAKRLAGQVGAFAVPKPAPRRQDRA